MITTNVTTLSGSATVGSRTVTPTSVLVWFQDGSNYTSIGLTLQQAEQIVNALVDALAALKVPKEAS